MTEQTSVLDTRVEWQKDSEPVEYKPTVWPNDIYPGVIIKVDVFEGKYGPKLRIIFEIVHPIHGSAQLAYAVTPYVSNKSKAGSLLFALGFKEGDTPLWGDIVGRQAKVLLEQKEILGVLRSVISKVMSFS